MALSAAVKRTFKGLPDEIVSLFADSDTYYEGAIIAESGGKGAVAATAVNQGILGIFDGYCDDGDRVDAKVIGASNAVKGRLKRGMVWLPHTGAAQTDVGGLFVNSSDDAMVDCPSTASARYIAYMALEYDASLGLLFDLRNPVVVQNLAS